MKAPVFILGTQRSGTTLLTRVLSAHPKIFIKNELQVNDIFQEGYNKSQILSAIKEQFNDTYNGSLEEILAQDNKTTWGLKDPELTYYLGFLEQFLPESKFIIIIRDPRGVVNSYKHNRWGLGTTAYTGTLRWIKEVNLQLDFLKKHPKNVLLIRFEDLVSNLESEIKNVCNHIEVSFDPALLNYYQSKSYIKKNRQNINTNKKPDITLTQKWQKELSAFEINTIETVAKDLIEKFHYKFVGQPIKLSKLQIFYFNLHQKVIGELQLQYRWKKIQIKKLLKI